MQAQLEAPALNCQTCGGQCCQYFAMQIDRPTTLKDFDHLRWYISHQQVAIFVEGKDWYLQVNTRCKFLAETGECRMYDQRPQICRDYGWDETGETECHENGKASDHDYFFSALDELEAYLLKTGKRWASISKAEFETRRRGV